MVPQQGGESSVQQGDVPARKLVRQLDFTSIYGGASATATASASASASASSEPSLRPTQSVVKPESPRASRPRPVFDSKEGTPKKSKQCNCKNSRCLKLYCECFASGTYCDGCNCVNCCNNVENEIVRQEAVEATLERNPNAFRPKIASSPSALRDNREKGMQDEGADKQIEKGSNLANNEDSLLSVVQNEGDSNENTKDDRLGTDQGEKASAGATSTNCVDDTESDGVADTRKRRAMSPGTLALMCDEQDTLFMASASPSGVPYSRGPYNHRTMQIYAEQERVVLTEFRDCLRRLITVGKWRATQFSTEAAKVEPSISASMQMNQQTVAVSRVARPVPLVPDAATVASLPVLAGSISTGTAIKGSLSGRPLENGDIQPKIETTQQ